MVVPLHVPEVMVPTVAKFGNDVKVVFVVAVIFPAVVAVVALPVNAPVNPVEVTEDKPETDVTVPPNVSAVDPNVVELFASCALVIAALLAKLLVVNPVADIVPEAMDIPEPAVKGA